MRRYTQLKEQIVEPIRHFIGDVHGLYYEYGTVIKNLPSSLQIGDFGIGFDKENDSKIKRMLEVTPQHKFFVGNHDNRKLAKELFPNNCLGDYGMIGDIFYVSGAFSIDKQFRVIGKSWWEDEEISYDELGKVIESYIDKKPEIMVTHDLPESMVKKLYGEDRVIKNRTISALEIMWKNHQPKYWIAGHHHMSKKLQVEDTKFIILNEMEVYKL
jgi:hypothetical protein